MSIRSRAAKTSAGGGAALGPTSTLPGRCAGISTPASASVGARSMKLTISSRIDPAATVASSVFGHRIISGTRRPES